MPSLNFNYQHPPFEKTIQLYGDRAGGKGNFEFAGFTQLQEVKFLLLHGNTESLKHPADWRRFLRLSELAQRLNKPIVLWNLPLIHTATTQHLASLTLSTAIQNTKLHLLKLPQPVISVFDEVYDWEDVVKELGWSDGSVLVKPEKKKLPTLPNLKTSYLKIVEEEAEIYQQILDILQEVSTIDSAKLVTNRLKSFHLPRENQE